jgi:hypothetical protein
VRQAAAELQRASGISSPPAAAAAADSNTPTSASPAAAAAAGGSSEAERALQALLAAMGAGSVQQAAVAHQDMKQRLQRLDEVRSNPEMAYQQCYRVHWVSYAVIRLARRTAKLHGY